MAARKKEPIAKAVTDKPERFRMSEMGNLGLNIFNGVSSNELKRELNFPNSVNTFREMSYHPTINAGLTLFENIISKATWKFNPPENATEEEKNQAKLVESMMHDMETPWSEFIKDALSANRFGFSVHEKVFRKRYQSNGSLYNDGLVGWKKLPIRAQESIDKFVFSEDGNEIIGVKQNLSRLNNDGNRFVRRSSNEVIIPRSKFILFRTGNHRGDPYGKSPLREVYLAWKFLVAFEEMEATGVAKDLQGIPVLYMPAQYLAADSSPEVQAIRSYYENALRNMQAGSQSAVILPQIFDEVSKQPLFKLELLSVDGKKAFDIDKIKNYYKNLIFTGMVSDILQLGQSSTGSFALGSIKNSMSGNYAERLLKEIVDVLNRELVRTTYELNGWNIERMGSFDYDDLDAVDLETFSKLVQRVASVGLVEVDREILNAVRKNIGVDPLPEDMEPQTDIMTGNSSRASDGLAKGSGNGTSDSVAGTDTSSTNLDNAA